MYAFLELGKVALELEQKTSKGVGLALGRLEELVGEIWDESDEIELDFVQTGENTYEVSGDMSIDDFFGEIEFDPKDFECEYSTMGGWAIEMLDADPHVGDSFSFSDRPDGEENDDDEEEQEVIYNDVSKVTRKMGHFIEFFSLGLFLFIFFLIG